MIGTRENYVKMIERLDQSVATVLKTLRDKGFAENTLVVFASDHGAMKPGRNLPYRDFKGTLFDGGIRVPLIVRWPGKVKAGTESAQVGTLMDLTRSFLAAAGAETPQQKLDGIDIIDHAVSGKADYPRTLYWRSRRGERTWWAVRDGDQKYVRRNDSGTVDEWLFDLKADRSETNNLLESKAAPQQAKTLKAKLKQWEKEIAPVR